MESISSWLLLQPTQSLEREKLDYIESGATQLFNNSTVHYSTFQLKNDNTEKKQITLKQ